MSSDSEILNIFETLALAAGKVVMRAWRQGAEAELKADHSPVTWADKEAEEIILKGLAAHCPDIPVVAEEAASAGNLPERTGETFLLVDPLDGTRELVAGRPDFTVNIALVRNGIPAAGVVHAPAHGTLHAGGPEGAWRVELSEDGQVGQRTRLSVRRRSPVPVVVVSRSHRTQETDRYIATLPAAEIISVGSSLKFCMVAEGRADVYPRFGRTMQWDTAAGDAVLRAAGGSTCGLDGLPLFYGPREGKNEGTERFVSPWFIASGGADC